MGEIVERDFGRGSHYTARTLRRVEALPTPILTALWTHSNRTDTLWGYSAAETRAELVRRAEGPHCGT